LVNIIIAIHLLIPGFINAVGVFQTYYEQNQLSTHTAFQIGWLSSFLVFFMNMGVRSPPPLVRANGQGVIIGPLFDMFGPRWLIFAANLFVIRANDDISLHRILAILLGPGHRPRRRPVLNVLLPSGSMADDGRFQTCVLCLNTWFLKKRGMAMGIMVSGSSLGGVCFPIMLDRLFRSVGFGWGVRAAGFLILGLLVIANFLLKSRLPPPGWQKGRKIFDFEALKEPTFVLSLVHTSFS